MSDSGIRTKLMDAAAEAAKNAHAPYSKFRVGAAVMAGGTVFTGANVESASYGLSLCAERSALAAAVSAGEREITHIAVVCLDPGPGGCTPCGACRQWIADLAPAAKIFLADREEPYTLDDLLPNAFRLV